MQNFAVDAEGGYLSVPVLSKEARMLAQVAKRFDQFCDITSAHGLNQGDTVYFTKVSDLADEGKVMTEYEDFQETSVTISRISSVLKEYGNSTVWTLKLDQLATLSIHDILVKALINDMAKVMDKAAATEFLASDLVYTPQGTFLNPTYALVSNGTPTVAASRNLNTQDIKNLVDLAAGTYLIPPYDGEDYICIASSQALRGIVDDPAFERANLYGRPEDLFSGEVGRYYNTRFIRENHVLTTSLAGGCGQAVFFGADAVQRGEALYPEIWVTDRKDSFGRIFSMCWYWLGCYKRIWDYSTDTQERIIVIGDNTL